MMMFEEPAAQPAPPAGASDKGTEFPSYLMRRQGIYYFKRRIPADVVRTLKLPNAQIWKSLETDDLQLAVKKREMELREFDALVASARARVKSGKRTAALKPRGEGTTKYLLSAHIPSLLSRFEYGLLSTDDEERKLLDREERAERLEMLEQGLLGLYDMAAAEDYSSMEEVAQMLLEMERLVAPPRSEVRQELLRELLVKDIELMEIQRDRLKGRMRLTPKELPAAPRDLPTMLDLVGAWKRKQSQTRTVDAYLGFVQDFESLVGALPVIALKKEHALLYRDDLAARGLSRDTVKNRVGGLTTILRYGLQEGLCALPKNPFDDVSYDAIPERPAFQDRRGYEMGELVQLFQSPLYTQRLRVTGQAAESAYWAPLLGPFVGGRIEEIAQLRVEDVQCINGVWALRIASLDADQHLKTESSYRLVPLHEEVIKCGFLAYVAGVKRDGYDRVFPSQRNANKYERWGNALGKWYSGYLDSIGLSDERLCYHSFRFTFKQRCTLCGIENEVRDALAGHWYSKNDAGRGYMRATDRQYPFPALVDAIRKLDYAELDLSHLHVKDPYNGVD